MKRLLNINIPKTATVYTQQALQSVYQLGRKAKLYKCIHYNKITDINHGR